MEKMKMTNKWVAGFCLLLLGSCGMQKQQPAARRYHQTDTLSLHRLDSFGLKRQWNLTGHATVHYEQITFSKPDSSGRQYIETLNRTTADIDRETTASDTFRQQTEQTVSESKSSTVEEAFKSPKESKHIWKICFILITGVILWMWRK